MIETKFKHTDIGLVPEDWEIKTLDEIGTFSKGASISRAESQTGKIPAIRYGELYTDHDDYIRTFKSHISAEVAARSHKIHKGDILFTASGETKEDIGKSVAFINDFDAYAGGDLIILSPKVDYDPVFMGYITNSKPVRMQKASRGQGDAVVHIVTDDVKAIEIPFPPFKEQQRIASALMKVDALISNLDKLIAKKQAIKKGAMQELLTGKKRLPGFKGEWKECPLSAIADNFTGLTYRPEDVSDFGILVLRSANIQNGLLDFHNNVRVTMKIPQRAMAKENDILVCVRNGSSELIGKSALIQNIKEPMAFGAFMTVLRTKKPNDFRYVFFSWQTKYIYDQIHGNSSATINQITNKDIDSLIIKLPPSIDEQRAIAHVLSTIDSDISLLQKKREKYQQIKQGMMHDLLTGRIRLVDNDDIGKKLDGTTRYGSYTVGLHKDPFDGAIAAEPHPD